MAPPRHLPPPTEQQQAAAAAAVRLPDFHADSPQSWFTNLDSQFATANITQSLTKFHWAVAKLPFSLNPTIQPLADDPYAVIRRSLHHFTLRIGDRVDKVSTLRLKPCTDPAAPPALPRVRGRPPAAVRKQFNNFFFYSSI
jgi:hypothetical protein